MKYQIGMRVWIDGDKFVITEIKDATHFPNEKYITAYFESDKDSTIGFYSDDDGVKVILRNDSYSNELSLTFVKLPPVLINFRSY